MRHHGGTQNRGGHQHRIGALEAWDQAPHHRCGIRRGHEQARDEPEGDDQQHHDDDPFERGLRPAALEPQHHRGGRADHQAADEQRQAKQQIKGDSAADHLGQIRGDGDDLRLHEKHEPSRVAHTLPQQFRQALAGDDAELRRLVLNQHAHRVRQHQHPYQQVAVSCAGRDVRRHIARIDIGDRSHERRSQDAGARTLPRHGCVRCRSLNRFCHRSSDDALSFPHSSHAPDPWALLDPPNGIHRVCNRPSNFPPHDSPAGRTAAFVVIRAMGSIPPLTDWGSVARGMRAARRASNASRWW